MAESSQTSEPPPGAIAERPVKVRIGPYLTDFVKEIITEQCRMCFKNLL